MSNSSPDPDSKVDPEAPPKKGFNFVGFFIFLVIIGGGGYYGYRYWENSKLYQTTDDAQVEGDVVNLSAEVQARVLKVHVQDNQSVKKGDVLVELEDTDYSVKVDQAKRQLQVLAKRQQASQAQLNLTRHTGDAGIQQGESGIDVAQAAVATAQSGVAGAQDRLVQTQQFTAAARSTRAKFRSEVDVARAEARRLDDDVKRYRQLFAQEEVSRQQLEATLTLDRQARLRIDSALRDVQTADAQVAQAVAAESQARENISQNLSSVAESKARVEEARSKLLTAQTAPQQLAVASANVKVSHADFSQAQSNLKLAEKDLERCRVVAPADGVVSKRSVLEGSYVQKGSPLMSLVETQQLWVIANYKETQMTDIKANLKAEVEVDSYPGQVLKGHVESIQSGTGARFSLLPPENAAGSFVKVVQRIPVKIVFDKDTIGDKVLRPGMSVQAKIRLP
jgi:membrane fusion protein (multidrug efflux system)